MTTFFVDPVSGSFSAAGTSFATRVIKPSAITGTPPTAGDVIRYKKSPDPISLGGADWTLAATSGFITLAASAAVIITTCGGVNWTAASGNTCSINSSYSRSTSVANSQEVSFTSSSKAYFPLGSTKNLSAFQKISMNLRVLNKTGTSPYTISFQLCSDAGGAVPVNTLTIPNNVLPSSSSSLGWIPLVLDNGSPLGSSIQSIAIVFDNPFTGVNIDLVFNDIVATNNLTHNHVIGKGTGTETNYAVRYIRTGTGVSTIVEFDTNPNLADTTGINMLYGGSVSGLTNVDTYVRDCLLPPVNSLISGTVSQAITYSGTSTNPLLISGGWDTTNMSSQTGETWLSGGIGANNGMDISGDYVAFDGRIASIKWNEGWNITGLGASGDILAANNCTDTGIYNPSGTTSFGNIMATVGNAYGIYNTSNFLANNLYNCWSNTQQGLFSSGNSFNITGNQSVNKNAYVSGTATMQVTSGGGSLGNATFNGNSGDALLLTNKDTFNIRSLVSTNNGGYSLKLNGASVYVLSLGSTGNTSGAIQVNNAQNINHYINNPVITESTKVTGLTNYANQRVYFQSENNVLNNNTTYTDGATVTTDVSTPTQPIYKVAVQSVNRNKYYPYRFEIPPGFAVGANGLVTFTIHINLPSSNISAQLLIPGGQLTGVPNDLTINASGAGFNPYTLTFTPTQQGVFQAYVLVWSDTGSTTDYVQIKGDTDMITQA